MKAGFEKLAGELLERLHAAGADAEVMEAVRERDRLREELAARQHQYELIGFTTPSYVEEWLSTRDPALLPLMAYHGNHRVAVFTLKDGVELAWRGDSPQFDGTIREQKFRDVVWRPEVPTLPVAVEAQQREEPPTVASYRGLIEDAIELITYVDNDSQNPPTAKWARQVEAKLRAMLAASAIKEQKQEPTAAARKQQQSNRQHEGMR